VVNLLNNPQTLGLLANAIHDEQWPTTRQDTFRLACEKLAEETNNRHRDTMRNHPEFTEKLLDVARHLCAVLLLSDKPGVALDPEQADVRFPFLDDCAPFEREVAYETVRRKLFRPEGEERFVPSHRSIAEYLAARWLAKRIDGDGLPLGRVMNLMLGRDGRTIAGLRGFYGWLALHCQAARSRLLDADPLTTVVYGDVKPLPPADKRRIIDGLRREAECYAGFRWDVSPSHPFGTLAAPELADDFIAALESPERDEAAQAFADCVLDILAEGKGIPKLAGTLKRVVVDDTRWGRVRQTALQAWLKLMAAQHEALELLNAVIDGDINDSDDELAGLLLRHLYPGNIVPETLLRYLHIPKDGHLIGHFAVFWEHELLIKAPDSHLPIRTPDLTEKALIPKPTVVGWR